jgi:hypothetical protein
MIRATVLEEPELEFGFAARHIEQRAGLMLNGPADIEMGGRRSEMRIGIAGPAKLVPELADWLKATSKGIAAKESPLGDLFPAFPGCSASTGFMVDTVLPREAQRGMSKARLRPIADAADDVARVEAAVRICAEEVETLHQRAAVDVVMVIRPDGVPAGVPEGGATGADFHDLLKARLITLTQPIQIIRPATWRGGRGVEDQATCAWNLFSALYYKAGGKPWRLVRDHSQLTRCYVGVSFTQSDEGDQLLTSVAQVFNELGDGVIVRGGLAKRSQADHQPHLSKEDAAELLQKALDRYRDEHKTLPAAVTLHTTSSFSPDEEAGFQSAADGERLAECELLWVSTYGERAMLVRGTEYHPPLRGTLLTLSDSEHALYTHGSVPYYRTYPGLYVPRPIGIRPFQSERPIEHIASEILALTKLNWNRARLDGTRPITLLTAERVGSILRHVPLSIDAAPRYANYM